jgi:hypothetical protein
VSHFSNDIEGTIFTVGEPEDIPFNGKVIDDRSDDSHDILGTFTAAINQTWRDQPPQHAEGFLTRLRNVNKLVMPSRQDRKTWRVERLPQSSRQHLFRRFRACARNATGRLYLIRSLIDPLARALMTMFVVTEVHPFMGGRGRAARLSMNYAFRGEGRCRISLPTVYREDYLLPLKALSHNKNAAPIVEPMIRIQRWTSAFELLPSPANETGP